MDKVLQNIRVLDITRYVAGPICSAQLADLGAEVIHIESPGGSEDRSPLPVDPNYPAGAGFIQVNRNKKGLTLDLGSPACKPILDRLVERSDILVMNLPLKAAQSMGIDYDAVRKIRADIIVVHITSFGAHGPYAERTGFDAIAQVMSGGTHLSGWPGEPIKSAAPWVDMTTGNHAVTGALAALLHRNATGQGQLVEVNLWQSALSVVNYFLMEEALTGMGREGIGNRAPSGAPADLVPTLDGAIYVAVLGNPMFKRFARLIGQESLLSDPRFATDEMRASNGLALSEITGRWAAGKSTAQALDLLAQARIPAGPLLKPRDVLSDEHVRAAGYVQDIEVPGLPAPVPYIRPAYHLSASPASIESGPPMPGQHTDVILESLGYTSAQIDEFRKNAVI